MRSEDFREFYNKYFRFSVRIANEIVNDRDMAQDIAQEAFCSLYKSKASIFQNNEKMLYALVKRVTINKALDYWKHAHLKREFIEEDEFMEDHLIDERCSLEAKILRMEEREYEKLVLQRLRIANPVNYEILMKVKFLDISPDEVAEEYGLTRNGVNNRIFRTKRWIEREMSRLYDD